MSLIFDKVKDIKGKVEKVYMFRGKLITIVSLDEEGIISYYFKIHDKNNKKDYYSTIPCNNLTECEKNSMKVVKKI